MNKISNKKGVGFYSTLIATVCSLLACLLYSISRENVSEMVTYLLAAAVVAGAIVALVPFKCAEYVPFALNAVPFGLMTYILIENISQIFFKNNVIGISVTFIAAFAFMVVAMITSSVSLVADHKKD